MEQRSVFVAVGNICSNFTSNLKYISQIVRYSAKQQPYDCKLVLIAKDRTTDKTIFYTLVKIPSVHEADKLPSLLQGLENYLHNYYNYQD